MEQLKKHYDRVILIVVGLITLVAGSMLIMKSFAIGQNFPGVDPGNGDKFEKPPVAAVTEASKHLDVDKEWKSPVAEDSEKVYRLMASIPIVWKDGAEEPIDLYDEKTPVRPPVSNKFLMDNNLPYRRDDVLTLDLDGDEFSNLEEYEGGTDPRDKEDFPDATNKLVLTGISETPYIVMFASAAGGTEFSLKRLAPPGARLLKEERWPTTWVKQGESFPSKGTDANRFTALKFEVKDIMDKAINRLKKDQGVLTVKDTRTDTQIELVQRAKTDIPVFRASFSYDGPGGKQDFPEKQKGDVFPIKGTDISLKILKVTKTDVEIEKTTAGKNPKTFTRSTKTP